MIYIGTHLVMAICITLILSVPLYSEAFDGDEAEISIVRDKSSTVLRLRVITVSLYLAAAAIVISFIR